MHSGFEIPGIQHQQAAAENPVLLSMNQTHILDQIHNTLPTTQQLFLDQHHFLPRHHYVGGGAAPGGGSSAYFPLNFKLGLNEICSRNEYRDNSVSNNINEGADGLLRGNEQYELPETRHPSLGMLHCWQNQQDSAHKQPRFWEPLPAEVSNENSEIVDRQEINQKDALTNCLESKSRVHFGELEAIYKRLGTNEGNHTCPNETQPVNVELPIGFDHGSEASIGEDQATRKKRRKKKRKESGLVSPMSEFFENLVKQVMDHQENLHKKFAEVIERLDEEGRAREEAWRNQELALFEEETAARERERKLAKSREAMIVSYLEKITGQRIVLPTCDAEDDGDGDARRELDS